MANITNAAEQIVSAQGAIEHGYERVNMSGEPESLAFAVLALAEAQLAIARALEARD
jgi:hypothetical protein